MFAPVFGSTHGLRQYIDTAHNIRLSTRNGELESVSRLEVFCFSVPLIGIEAKFTSVGRLISYCVQVNAFCKGMALSGRCGLTIPSCYTSSTAIRIAIAATCIISLR